MSMNVNNQTRLGGILQKEGEAAEGGAPEDPATSNSSAKPNMEQADVKGDGDSSATESADRESLMSGESTGPCANDKLAIQKSLEELLKPSNKMSSHPGAGREKDWEKELTAEPQGSEVLSTACAKIKDHGPDLLDQLEEADMEADRELRRSAELSLLM